MQAEITSFWEWQQHFLNKKSCLQAMTKQRWPAGFSCPKGKHNKGWLVRTRHAFEYADCHHHTSITADTLFHITKLPLVKWFCYRLNRRFWEDQIPNRLLRICIDP